MASGFKRPRTTTANHQRHPATTAFFPMFKNRKATIILLHLVLHTSDLAQGGVESPVRFARAQAVLFDTSRMAVFA
jgi:hypothetical protein